MEFEIGIGKTARRAYGFDEVASVPSRRTRDPEDVSIEWEIDAYTFPLPMMASAMDAAVSPSTAIAIGKVGGLAWVVPGGIIAAVLARAFFRFQRQDVDSSVRDAELLFERARVIVPLSSKTMGKVRVRLGQSVVERYALTEDEEEAFRTGDVIEIVRVEDDCVYVRRAVGRPSVDELS